MRRRTALVASITALTVRGVMGSAYNVTNLNDSGSGSLRDAINQANFQETGTIQIQVPGTITLQSPLPAIIFQGSINGTGMTTINGNNLYRPFFVDLEAEQPLETLAISNLTISNGRAQGGNGGNGTFGGGGGLAAGGAIFVNSGAVTLTNVTTSNSSAIGGKGGSYVSDPNTAQAGGGGGGLGGNGGAGGNQTGGGGGGLYGNGGSGS